MRGTRIRKPKETGEHFSLLNKVHNARKLGLVVGMASLRDDEGACVKQLRHAESDRSCAALTTTVLMHVEKYGGGWDAKSTVPAR